MCMWSTIKLYVRIKIAQEHICQTLLEPNEDREFQLESIMQDVGY